MAKIKDFDNFSLNEDNIPMKEWLPSDFDFREYVDENLPSLTKRILEPKQIEHVTNILEMLAKEYSGEKSDDDFVESLLTEKYDKALMLADDVNRIAFYVYVIFQVNKVPIVLREKYKI